MATGSQTVNRNGGENAKMPKRKTRKRRTQRNPYNSVMKMTTDVAKTAIGVSATAFVVAKVTDALS